MLSNLIIPVLNRYDLLQRCLDSVNYPIEHLLIIDNGASEHAEDLPINLLTISDFFSEVTYLPMPANLGVAESWNLGIKSFPFAENWFFASNDVEFHGDALERLSGADRDSLTLSGMFPFWQVFSLGYEACRRVGFFDSGFFPAYFEDNDYARRCEHFGVPIKKLDLNISHDNSSTLRSNPRFIERNKQTFSENQKYFEDKIARNDFGPGGWDVERRRRNAWESGR